LRKIKATKAPALRLLAMLFRNIKISCLLLCSLLSLLPPHALTAAPRFDVRNSSHRLKATSIALLVAPAVQVLWNAATVKKQSTPHKKSEAARNTTNVPYKTQLQRPVTPQQKESNAFFALLKALKKSYSQAYFGLFTKKPALSTWASENSFYATAFALWSANLVATEIQKKRKKITAPHTFVAPVPIEAPAAPQPAPAIPQTAAPAVTTAASHVDEEVAQAAQGDGSGVAAPTEAPQPAPQALAATAAPQTEPRPDAVATAERPVGEEAAQPAQDDGTGVAAPTEAPAVPHTEPQALAAPIAALTAVATPPATTPSVTPPAPSATRTAERLTFVPQSPSNAPNGRRKDRPTATAPTRRSQPLPPPVAPAAQAGSGVGAGAGAGSSQPSTAGVGALAPVTAPIHPQAAPQAAVAAVAAPTVETDQAGSGVGTGAGVGAGSSTTPAQPSTDTEATTTTQEGFQGFVFSEEALEIIRTEQKRKLLRAKRNDRKYFKKISARRKAFERREPLQAKLSRFIQDNPTLPGEEKTRLEALAPHLASANYAHYKAITETANAQKAAALTAEQSGSSWYSPLVCFAKSLHRGITGEGSLLQDPVLSQEEWAAWKCYAPTGCSARDWKIEQDRIARATTIERKKTAGKKLGPVKLSAELPCEVPYVSDVSRRFSEELVRPMVEQLLAGENGQSLLEAYVATVGLTHIPLVGSLAQASAGALPLVGGIAQTGLSLVGSVSSVATPLLWTAIPDDQKARVIDHFAQSELLQAVASRALTAKDSVARSLPERVKTTQWTTELKSDGSIDHKKLGVADRALLAALDNRVTNNPATQFFAPILSIAGEGLSLADEMVTDFHAKHPTVIPRVLKTTAQIMAQDLLLHGASQIPGKLASAASSLNPFAAPTLPQLMQQCASAGTEAACKATVDILQQQIASTSLPQAIEAAAGLMDMCPAPQTMQEATTGLTDYLLPAARSLAAVATVAAQSENVGNAAKDTARRTKDFAVKHKEEIKTAALTTACVAAAGAGAYYVVPAALHGVAAVANGVVAAGTAVANGTVAVATNAGAIATSPVTYAIAAPCVAVKGGDRLINTPEKAAAVNALAKALVADITDPAPTPIDRALDWLDPRQPDYFADFRP
jgi:hypothetical protein